MDSSDITGNTILEPRDDMEFESHEAAYSFYKEYAKSMGFGTAKLNSRRSRASKEFIDAKFSCIRYGNKQQSDEAINPRPSPKIGCKASMHVKRSKMESGVLQKNRNQATQRGTWNVGAQDGCHQMELSDTRPAQIHNFVQTPLQVLPTMFHNITPTQFHNVLTTHLQDNRLPQFHNVPTTHLQDNRLPR